MKMFLIITALALLFVIGSALALTAIGRNTSPPKTKTDEKSSGNHDR